ncbi:energy-coupled thiamine transporter ThiT [Caldibacillus lycopersici]|uniref:Energy-coupled thiamine transporter ThiT n=1 Tax=Perspicuibacillus lycopersici TaxID=1325689 RepID=A0AAE3IWH2_9BACI|nr:energy-coupled thiamine transporter ThiT [Perspicuibacillus lycopersici]MCU9614674.1 energy-coupled thiamine transporter ThiT [Perspicuibacillus lycopersici]
MRKMKLQTMIEVAIMAALALILDLLPSIDLGPWISISFAMVPVFLVAFRWGFVPAFVSGLIWGLLQVVIGDFYFLSVIQFLMEYFLAFALIGFAGFFMPVIQKMFKERRIIKGIIYVIIATFVGSVARYFIHYIAGIVFWGSEAPEGQPAWLYSLIVNGTAALGSFLFCAVVLSLLLSVAPRLLTANINAKR